MSENDRLYRPSEVAEMIGVSTTTLRRVERLAGVLPLRVGPRGDRRYSQLDVRKFITAIHRGAPRGGNPTLPSCSDGHIKNASIEGEE